MRFPATVIDPSTLPKPLIIGEPDYESELAFLKVDALARAAEKGLVLDTLDIESELISVVFEAAAYRLTLKEREINDAALALMLAFAVSSDLDHIGLRFGVTRMLAYGVVTPRGNSVEFPEDWEGDERFRQRIQLAPDAYSNAGTLRGYKFHTMSASIEVEDCSVFSSAPGRVDIVILGEDAAPSDAALNAVYSRVTSDDVKPLTDDVRVSKALVLPYTVSGLLRIPRGPDPKDILAEAKTKAGVYAASTFKVGSKVYRSGYYAALQVPNVFNVVLSSPLDDLDPGNLAAAKATLDLRTEVVDG